MPQLVAIALVGALAWYAVRALRREMARIDEEVRAQEEKSTGRDLTKLERGDDGVYRPGGKSAKATDRSGER